MHAHRGCRASHFFKDVWYDPTVPYVYSIVARTPLSARAAQVRPSKLGEKTARKNRSIIVSIIQNMAF